MSEIRIHIVFVAAIALGGVLLGMGMIAGWAVVAGLGGLTMGVGFAPWMVEVMPEEET